MRAKYTLTRAEIALEMQYKLGISRSKSQAMVGAILQHITAALEQGEDVKISRFGTFKLRNKAERVGRNPNTGMEALIAPRQVVTFRACRRLKQGLLGQSNNPDGAQSR